MRSTVKAAPREDAAAADIVFVVVNRTKLLAAMAGLPDWKGRIVIDAKNAIKAPLFKPVDLGGRASSEVFTKFVPGARVVKAFNHLRAELLATDPSSDGGRRQARSIPGRPSSEPESRQGRVSGLYGSRSSSLYIGSRSGVPASSAISRHVQLTRWVLVMTAASPLEPNERGERLDRDAKIVFELIEPLGDRAVMSYGCAMSQHPLFRIISDFKREPSRTGSLIITFYGDAILPRGGSVWLGTLLAFLEMLEIDGGVVRTAMSRLAADGWLDREKVGRKSFYKLAPSGRERFASAVAHVYNPQPSEWEGFLELLLISNGGDRETSRAALSEAGFGNLMPGVWVAVAGVAKPSIVAGAIRLKVSTDDEMGRQLIEQSWQLQSIAESYGDFLKMFGPLEAAMTGKNSLSHAEALLGRILLIHQYRRVLLRDPLLPHALLPPDWPAAEARSLCGRIYRTLLPASELWLDEHGDSAAGPLPPPGRELLLRFSGR